MKRLFALLLLLAAPALAQSVATIHGECAIGNTKTIIQGLFSSTLMRVSYPQCLVTVYDHGTTNLSTLYSDDSLTPLSNPFTGSTNGHFVFYATVGQRYDVVLSGGLGANNVGGIGFPSPYTIADIYLFAGGSSCTGVSILHNGILVGSQPGVNFIDSTTVTWVAFNNILNSRIDLTASASGGGGGGAVSAENVDPLMSSNSPAPATTNDIIYTLYKQDQNTAFMGPITGQLGSAKIQQIRLCQDNSGVSALASCTFAAPVLPGDIILTQISWYGAAHVPAIPQDNKGDTFTSIHTGGTLVVNQVGQANNVVGGLTTVTSVVVPGSWQMSIVEVTGANPSTPVDVITAGVGSCSNFLGPSAQTWESVTTTTSDFIVGMTTNNTGVLGAGYETYAGTNGWELYGQQKSNSTGSANLSQAVLAQWQAAAGTYTPTAEVDNYCSYPDGVTVAFKNVGTDITAKPVFRDIHYSDLIPIAGFPPLTVGYLYSDGNFLSYKPGGSGGSVTSFSSGNLSPLFTTTVTNPTTTPFLSFSLSSFSADNIYGNFTGSPAAPSTQVIPACANDGAHALVYVGHVLTCASITVSGGDTIVSPNSTLNVGGTSSNTTLDVVGAAGKMLAGATPALTYTPSLGVDGSSAGTLQLANGSVAFHTIIGTQATANWTFKFPTTAGISGQLLRTDGSGNTNWVTPSVGVTPQGYPFSSVTTLTIPGATHGFGTKNLILQCYDNASPQHNMIFPAFTVNDSTFDVVVTFTSATSGYCVLI